MMTNDPVIRVGQVWALEDGGDVTVRDFAEYTCGWMVTVDGATPHLLSEAEFRRDYRLVRDAA